MNRSTFVLIFASVIMTSLAQIMLKAGMSAPDVVRALSGESRISVFVTVILNPWVLFGLALYAGATMVWLLVLAKVDVSLAYPFVGLGFVVTMVLAWAFMGETVSATRVAGTLLIAAGVFVLARS